jgi:hypothetical protein
MENGQTYPALDLSCVDDDDAKQQMANLSHGRDVEVWEGDRRVALVKPRKRRGDAKSKTTLYTDKGRIARSRRSWSPIPGHRDDPFQSIVITVSRYLVEQPRSGCERK